MKQMLLAGLRQVQHRCVAGHVVRVYPAVFALNREFAVSLKTVHRRMRNGEGDGVKDYVVGSEEDEHEFA